MRRQPRQHKVRKEKRAPREWYYALQSVKRGDVMSMVSEALRNEETRAGGSRTVAGVVNSVETLEGEGFLVRRPFPKAAFSDFDPFLLLDEMGPMEVAPGEAKGAPDHS